VIDKFIERVDSFLKENGRVLIVQSTLSNIQKTTHKMGLKGFSTRILGKKQFDFETLECIEGYYPKGNHPSLRQL
jgi:release factor glutamine methyltransferase